MLPLEGVTVVSIEQAVAAPFATRQLADLGARVIKIEREETGDFARHYDTTVNGMASHFVWINRSKESIVLNLKEEKDKHVLNKLLEKSDVFVQNLAPGAIDRLGYGKKNLRKQYPKLIICNLSGYGDTGPYKSKKAYDLLMQCESGLVSVTGTKDTPSKVGISAGDIAAGMYMFSGILTALFARTKSGEGKVIDISMLEALGEWMGYPMYYARYGGENPKRTGASHSTIYPYGPIQSGDGKTIFIGLQNEREWKRFCEDVLHKPDLSFDERFISNAKRSENRRALKNLIEKVFNQLTSKVIIQRLESAQIANARLNTMKDFFSHPQLIERQRWSKVATPNGEIDALLPPMDGEDIETVMRPVPALGEHTKSILKELGITPGTV